MPITITTPLPGSPIGPGMGFNWQSDFIGPIGANSHLHATLSLDSEGIQTIMFGSHQTSLTSGGMGILTVPSEQWGFGQHAQVEGQPVHLVTQLVDGSNGQLVDSGEAQFVWAPSSGEAIVTQEHVATGGTGLSPLEAQQLDETHASTWPEHLVDQLLTADLGHGSSTSPVAGNLTTPVFGVIVRITAIPETLAPQTPDGLYFVKTLASVLIFRGSDIWLRIPIHTPSKLINLWVEGLALGLVDAVLSAGWLLNLSIQVFFLEGVEGDVLLMRTP